MIGKLLISAIVIDILIVLTGSIPGARQFLAYGAAVVFFIQCFVSISNTSVVGRLLSSSIYAFLALGVLVAPVASCVRESHFQSSGSSTNCELGMGGQMLCRQEP